MSLLDALGIAGSGLQTTQAAVSVVSENVANAQNPNYVDEQAVLATLPGGGGVEIAGIQRATDTALQQQTLAQSSQASGDAALSSLYQQLENVTGGDTTSPALSSAATQFTTAWQTFEATPEDNTASQGVIQAASNLTQTLANTAQGLDQLAQTAAGQVGDQVTTLNQDLSQIAQLNGQIVAAQADNTPVPNLLDQRDTDVAAIAQLVPVQTVARPDGSLSLFTTNGLALVDQTPTSFSWDGTNITTTGSTTSLNSSFQSGSIGATLGFLQTGASAAQSSNPAIGVLQKTQDQLNAFASSLYNSAATPAPAFEAAYDGATTQSGELASSFFTTSDGSATATALNLTVNPALLDGTAQIKQASATPVVAALTATNQSLSAGGLSVTGQNFAGIANAIIANDSSNAATAASNATSSAATSSALSTQLSGVTGVNMDSEMTNLILLQNSYSASARVVSTISTMLTSLLAIGQ